MTATSSEPLNFSRVDTSLPYDILIKEYPKYVDVISRGVTRTVELHAGEMLYIPAGWFHEVKSIGEAPYGHMAFNYWFHPPDTSDYERPYSNEFWKLDWEKRKFERQNFL